MNANIQIKSLIDGEELINSYDGSVTFQEDVTLLSYVEETCGEVDDAESMLGEICTNICIKPHSSNSGYEILIEKTGALCTQMYFLKGAKTQCNYHTPFGDMPLTIDCEGLHVDYGFQGSSGSPSRSKSISAPSANTYIIAEVSYALYSGEELISTHKLEIKAESRPSEA